MKKIFLGLIFALLFSSININLVGASVNDFTITDFQADYYLDKDSEGRSTLKTIEIITAKFPNIDQNHGIERAIPKSYDGHSVSLDIKSVTDENNQGMNYSTYDSNGNLVLRIGDADTYVYGLMTYKIIYTGRDVTKYFADTNDDEFYWDINGTEWSQIFDKVTARIHVSESLAGALTDNKSCYIGLSGSSNKCEIKKSGNDYVVEAANLKPNNNVSIAIGFKPHTFSAYQASSSEKLLRIAIIAYFVFCAVATVVIVVLLIKIIRLKATKGVGALGRGTIIAEYLPPRNADVALSAVIAKKESTWISAMFIDLAVRGNIKIIEQKEGIFNKSVYSLQYVSSDNLSVNERAVVNAVFEKRSIANSLSDIFRGLSVVMNTVDEDIGGTPSVGDIRKLDVSDPDYSLSSHLMRQFQKLKKTAKTDGYYENDEQLKSTMNKMITAMTLLSIFSVFGVISFIVGIISIIVGASIIADTNPMTIKGRELYDYLEGLKLYIQVAEEDRIRILQSPQGAEKTPINTDDSAMMVKLYEKVLPYAVLFGNEKEWAKVLGKLYDQQAMQPNWYSGSDIFNAVMFSAALSSFSSTTSASSYSSPSSSSSGGSGGGGSSGGGGGGGGGGGW